jgi:pullulanase
MDFTSEDFARRQTPDEALGAFWEPQKTVFRFWAPEAVSVTLRLYQGWEPAFAPTDYGLAKGAHGVWQVEVPGDLSGLYYTYVTNYEGRGKMEGVDPYARAVGPQGQRGYLFDPRSTDPEGWGDDRPPALDHIVDSILYELHVRDASSLPSSGIQHRGKFLGLTEEGTRGPGGHPTGLDHIASLGVTHVHLLPVFDFDGVDDLDPEPEDYNWGYNPRNFNALKPAYSTDPRRPDTALREFKMLVQAFHRRGIRVVLDMVYNHTYATVDSHLNRAYPFYYYRMYGPHFSNGSGCGNELATERPMVRRYILDSLKYWKEEFHLDGFRFDLMGLYDLDTMNEVARTFRDPDPTFLLYGEGWTGGLSTLPDDRKAIKANAGRVPGIAFFSDENRDTLKGHVFEVERKGFVNGGSGQEWGVKFAAAGCTAHPALGRGTWATGPAQVINYVAAHDNHTLFDKLAHTNPHHSEADRIAMAKLAHGAVFLSQGIPFLHAGEEFLRTKKGVENSYNSPDAINGLDWEAAGRHQDVVGYLRGLIALRKARPELRLRDSAQVAAQVSFPELLEPHMVAWLLGGRLYVVLNAHPRSRDVHLPAGTWVLLADSTGVGTGPRGKPRNQMVVVPGRSLVVLFREVPAP